MARYAGDGTRLWRRRFGSTDIERSAAILADGDGAFVAGSTQGSLAGPLDGSSDGFIARFGFAVGSSYCGPAVPSSRGIPGRVLVNGSDAVAENAISLVALDLPVATLGYFLTSQTTGLVPMAGGSEGTLCLGGSVGRYNRSAEVGTSGSTGFFELAIDLADIPQPTGSVSTPAWDSSQPPCSDWLSG